MTLQQIDDPILVERIERFLSRQPYTSYVQFVRAVAGDRECLVIGGTVRDRLLEHFYSSNPIITDVDFSIDDSTGGFDLFAAFDGQKGVTRNRFGTIKWRPEEGVTLDVSIFSNSSRVKVDGERPSVAGTVCASDLTTSAIAYSLRDRIIYDGGALAAVQKREVELNYVDHDDLYITMTRLVAHAVKLGFKLGVQARELIARTYVPNLDSKIRGYAHDRNIDAEKMITMLSEIAKT